MSLSRLGGPAVARTHKRGLRIVDCAYVKYHISSRYRGYIALFPGSVDKQRVPHGDSTLYLTCLATHLVLTCRKFTSLLKKQRTIVSRLFHMFVVQCRYIFVYL